MTSIVTITLLATLTGLIAGALFAFFRVPIPAPPTLPGLMGIVGIYLGYQLISRFGMGYDLLDLVGL